MDKGEQNGPTLSSRALAIVHLAMYDAFAGITNNPGQLPRYISNPPSPGGATQEALSAAVAAAAYTTPLYPSQKPFFDGIFEGEGEPASAAHAFGVAVGQAILADRAMDPGAGGDYKPSPLPGKHRPDPNNAGQGFYSPRYGAASKGFGITARHELADPPFGDNTYLDAVREVADPRCFDFSVYPIGREQVHFLRKVRLPRLRLAAVRRRQRSADRPGDGPQVTVRQRLRP